MRFAYVGLILLAGLASGCSTEEKVDMSTMKSPQAGAVVPNLHASEKPKTSPYRIQKITDGLAAAPAAK